MIIKPIFETVFLPEWNTTAIICKDGTVYVYLRQGKAYTRDMLEDEPFFNEEMIKLRLVIFKKLDEYYEKNKRNDRKTISKPIIKRL